jgi:hypothetical protein
MLTKLLRTIIVDFAAADQMTDNVIRICQTLVYKYALRIVSAVSLMK